MWTERTGHKNKREWGREQGKGRERPGKGRLMGRGKIRFNRGSGWQMNRKNRPHAEQVAQAQQVIR
jgi:hypothetical protein